MRVLPLLILASATILGQAAQQAAKPDAVASPAGDSSSQANWALNGKGEPMLSWVETGNDGSDSLRYSVRHAGQWSAPRTIAAKRHFFRQAAEIPSLIALGDGTLVAEWIEGPAGDSDNDDAEFVYTAASKDGITWSKPVMANHDKSQSQHGLASIVASGPHEASIVWLQALKGDDGPASLMRTTVDAAGNVLKEESLNPDVCQCCPTSVVQTPHGLLIAYRSHTAQDIRDITVVRSENGKWLSNRTTFNDGWKINACPTNAASASIAGDHVAVAWYTAANNMARAEFALSADGGATFTKPAVISTGSAYGYVSTATASDGSATISWLERGANDGRLLIRHVSSTGALGPEVEVAKGSRMSLGYPRLVQSGAETWIAWGGGDSKVQTARVAGK